MLRMLRSLLLLALFASLALAVVVRTHPGEEGHLLASQLLQKAAMRSATQQQLLPAETSLTRHRPNGPARKLLAPDAEDERAHAPAEGKRLADEILAARKAKKGMMAWSA